MVGSIEDAKPISASAVPIASLVGQNESKESTIGGRRKRGRPKKQAAPPVVSQKAAKRDENLCNDVNMSDGGNVETLVPHHVDESSIAGRRKALGRSRKRAADAIKDQVEPFSAIPLASLNPVSENCGTSDISGVKDNLVKEGSSDGHCHNSVSRPRKQDIVKCDQNDHLNGAATKDGEPDDAEAKSDHMKVKDTLRLFNKHYLHFVQEEERRYKEVEATLSKASNAVKVKPKVENKKVVNASSKASKSSKAQKSKAEDGNEEVVKRASKRPDLKAISKMIEDQTVLNHQKRIGSIPGVDVGQQFFSRAEMVVLGLHGHWLNGIDYMGQGYSKLEMYKHLTFPVAVCIVLSGMYEDDTDNADEVVYTGQGGHDLLGSKHQISDQKMARGNLALKNNADSGVPVRVVRGSKATKEKSKINNNSIRRRSTRGGLGEAMDLVMGLEGPLMSTLQHLMDIPDEVVDKAINAPTRAYVRDRKAMAATPADVKELPGSYVFEMDMPGVKPGEIKVQVEDENVLVISGERKRGEEDKDGKYLRMERRVGKFMRKFSLPENANTEAISAVCRDGVLTVTVEKLPPPEPKKPKTVEVKVA